MYKVSTRLWVVWSSTKKSKFPGNTNTGLEVPDGPPDAVTPEAPAAEEVGIINYISSVGDVVTLFSSRCRHQNKNYFLGLELFSLYTYGQWMETMMVLRDGVVVHVRPSTKVVHNVISSKVQDRLGRGLAGACDSNLFTPWTSDGLTFDCCCTFSSEENIWIL